ncbi:MAG: hypothetical protein ACRERV_02695, partial [Methylococcales bacterium]
ETQPYLSSLHEANLQFLAGMSGLKYYRLESPDQFTSILQHEDPSASHSVETDIRWILALVSGVLMMFVYRFPASFTSARFWTDGIGFGRHKEKISR